MCMVGEGGEGPEAGVQGREARGDPPARPNIPLHCPKWPRLCKAMCSSLCWHPICAGRI